MALVNIEVYHGGILVLITFWLHSAADLLHRYGREKGDESRTGKLMGFDKIEYLTHFPSEEIRRRFCVLSMQNKD